MSCNENKNRRPDDGSEMTVAGVAVTIAAGLLVLGIGVMSMFSSSGKKKTMTAPGRNHRIFRDDFERDPAGYFRDLRKMKD